MSDDLKVGLKISTTTPGAEQVNALKDDVRDLGATSSRATGQQEAQAAASEKQGRSAKEGADGVGQLRGALEGLALAKLAQDFVRISAAQEANRKALDQLTGSAQAGGAEMEYLRSAADRLGVKLDDAARAYVGLSAATKGTNLEGQNTKAIFEAVVGAMSKLGKSSAQTENALLAVSQMASKGTISMEDLRGQLGEALPGALQSSAKAMGLTVAELYKLVSTGTVTADELLPKLAAQLNATFGSAPPDTLNAAMAQLENKVTAAIGAMNEAGTSSTVLRGAFSALSGITSALADIFNSAAEAIGVVGKGIAATFYSIQLALSGDFKGALTAWKTNMADAMDSAANNINKVRTAVGLLPGDAQAAAENTKPALAATATEADKLAAAFTATGTAAGGMSGSTGAAAQSIAQQFKLDTLQGVLDLADAFTIAGDKATAMSANVQAAIVKMNAGELASFSANLKTAFETGQIDAQRFAELNNTVLAQSFKNLGLDVDQAFGGISAKTGAAINSVDALVSSLQAAGQTGPAAAAAIGQALAAATNRADTQAGLEAIKVRIVQLKALLGEKITNGLLDQVDGKLQDAADKADLLEQRARKAGITTTSMLQEAATNAKSLALSLEAAGKPIEDQRQAWLKYYEAAVAANRGVVTEQMKVEAAQKGVTLGVDETGKSYAKLTSEVERLKKALEDAKNNQNELNQSIQGGVVLLGEANDAWQKNFHKDTGLTKQSDAYGSQVNSELGVINYLKSNGLSQEQAVAASKQFIDAKGDPKWNNLGWMGYGQPWAINRYGGQMDGSKTPEQLLNDAAAKAMGLGGAGSGASGTPGGNVGLRTVNVNLNLPGGVTKTVPVQGDAAAQSLIDALKQAGLSSSY